MQIFTDYIQPIILWLQIHPYWALFLTFFISLTESLAIIGSIIPGSVTMTAIGILAGSGVLRVDLTLLAATLGAIAGDSSSYLIGYFFSDRLHTMWPFRNYPGWLIYGKSYFSRHGGKSVLIGRFVGPLRSVIPLIAGMMHMSHWRFFTANVISAIGWSALYVLPGVAIGAASSELSPESATKLFTFVLLFLGGLWLLTVIIRWLLVRLNRFLCTQLHDIWSWSRDYPRTSKLIHFLTPAQEKRYDKTAGVFLALLVCLLFFCFFTTVILEGNLAALINQPSHLFLQSLRIFSFDVFFIVFSEWTNPLTLLSTLSVVCLLTIYYRDWRSLGYWLSLNITTALVLLVINWLSTSSSPEFFLDTQNSNTYPAMQLTFATAQFSALIFYLNKYGKGSFNRVLNAFLFILLLVNGIAPVYLGDNWVIDVIGAYLCGLSICLIHWIFYRRINAPLVEPALSLWILIPLLVSPLFSLYTNYEQTIRSHQPSFAQYVITDKVWWEQEKPLLPLFRTNRIGKPISLFNLQYVGTLSHLEAALQQFGWQKENESLFWSLMNRVNGKKTSQSSPLMAQLYLNKKPVLIMTFQASKNESMHVLRLWRSNYHLKYFRQPLWIGTVSPSSIANFQHKSKAQLSSLDYFKKALSLFSLRQIPINRTLPPTVSYPYKPELLLIKETPPLKAGLQAEKRNVRGIAK